MKKRPLVLAAEDDEDDFLLLSDAIREARPDVQMEWVKNGEELLEFLERKETPDLVFLDLNMPRKDGRESLKELRSAEKYPAVPIVILTNSSMNEDVLKACRFGANIFYANPAIIPSSSAR